MEAQIGARIEKIVVRVAVDDSRLCAYCAAQVSETEERETARRHFAEGPERDTSREEIPAFGVEFPSL